MREVQMKRVPHRQLTCRTAAALIAAASGLISPANAQTFSSSYTSTAAEGLPHHRQAQSSTISTTQVCPGKSGLVVVISEDDLRQTVSVGRNRAAAAKEPAAETWFGPFNSTAHTVEWRAVDGKPFAIIQRWLIADNDDPDKAGTPDLETDAGGDAVAAGAGLPCRLYRRPGQPQCQRACAPGGGRICA